MKYHRYSKYLFILIISIMLAYIPVLFDVNYNGTITEFDILYNELKSPEQKEDSFLGFISLGEKSCDYLLKKLVMENDILMKRDLLQIIGFIKCSNCEKKLVPFLKDPDWRIRFFTIDALDKLEYEKLSSLLRHIIVNDANRQVRIEAIIALGKSGNTKDLQFLHNLAGRKEYQNKKLIEAINMALANRRLSSQKEVD